MQSCGHLHVGHLLLGTGGHNSVLNDRFGMTLRIELLMFCPALQLQRLNLYTIMCL